MSDDQRITPDPCGKTIVDTLHPCARPHGHTGGCKDYFHCTIGDLTGVTYEKYDAYLAKIRPNQATKICAKQMVGYPRGVVCIRPDRHVGPCDSGVELPHEDVDQPPHYTSGPIEAIDAIRSMLSAPPHLDPFVDYCRGQAVKYLWRAGKKGSAKEDLLKAKRYLEWAIERLGD